MGTPEIIVLGAFAFYGLVIYAAIARVRRRLAKISNPTFWTYVNELGAYVIFAVFMVCGGIAMMIGNLAVPNPPAPSPALKVGSLNNWKIHRPAQSNLQISAPVDWELLESPNPLQLRLWNRKHDFHLIMNAIPKEDWTVSSHSELALQLVQQILGVAEESSITSMNACQIGPFPATHSEFECADSTEQVGMVFYTIDCGDCWGDIRVWSRLSQFEDTKRMATSIANTLEKVQ